VNGARANIPLERITMFAFLVRVATAGDVLPLPQAMAWRMLVAFGLPNAALAALLWMGLALGGLDGSWALGARALAIGLTPFLVAFGGYLGVGLATNATWRTDLWAALRPTAR
jgi:hypothetical protein